MEKRDIYKQVKKLNNGIRYRLQDAGKVPLALTLSWELTAKNSYGSMPGGHFNNEPGMIGNEWAPIAIEDNIG